MIGEARKLKEENMPFPSNVKKALESYERDKARNRVYLYVLFHSTRHELTFTIEEKRGRQKRERSTCLCHFPRPRMGYTFPSISLHHNPSIPLLLSPWTRNKNHQFRREMKGLWTAPVSIWSTTTNASSLKRLLEMIIIFVEKSLVNGQCR